MKKQLLHFSMITTILLFGACSNEELLPETSPETGRTMSFTATMPDKGPSTRLALEQDGINVAVRWLVGDEIQLTFITETDKINGIVMVDSISNGGKTAHFDIPIPVGEIGKIYGVYGGDGGGINIEGNNTLAILPTNPGRGVTNDMMLYFEYDMEANTTLASVKFKHLGSLFNIFIKNVNEIPNDSLNPINEVRLFGIDGDTDWAYNSIVGGQSFDLESKLFLNQESAGNYISFYPANSEVNEGIITLRAWYPLLPTKVWPKLELQLRNLDGTNSFITTVPKAAKLEAPIAGKSYNFYAEWDNDLQELIFVAPF